jgi:uncharacterized circularly permuted ATP-grasp superfamily protein
VCQIFRFYGFDDVHPNMFADLTKENMVAMFRFLSTDLNEMRKKPHRALVYCTPGTPCRTAYDHQYLYHDKFERTGLHAGGYRRI